MEGIRIRIEKEMTKTGITQRVPPTRPQSLDDYFLLNNVGGNGCHERGPQSLKSHYCNPYHPH